MNNNNNNDWLIEKLYDIFFMTERV
jgi:hypothetical protein